MNLPLQQQVDNLRRNPKISKALEVFEHAQKTYEQAIDAIALGKRSQTKGTYSSSISKKEYHANISTTTR